MKLTGLKVFPIEDDKLFESFCLDYYKIKYRDPNMQLNGRSGQRQNGVDIFGHINEPYEWLGIQCKVKSTSKSLSISEVKIEAEKAEAFNPKLSHYVVATTGNRDAKLQEELRLVNEERKSKKVFEIQIEFWDDILVNLSETEYERIIIKYYNEFIIDSLKHGFTVGRLVTIILGEMDDYSTQYELLISKIPLIDESKEYGILYFQNRYVVCNLNSRGFSIIQNDCHPSDFETAIRGYWGQFLVAKWLRNSDINEIINSDTDFYYCSFTKEEHDNFMARDV